MRVLGIIPARAGSKRIPQKNFRPFAGTTLTDLAIQQGLQATCLHDVLVSSDSPEVLRIARTYSGVIVLERPAELATDASPAIDYQVHALNYMKETFDKVYDLVVVIQPSSPLRSGKDIDSTVALMKMHPEADSAVSVAPVQHMIHPHKVKIMEGDRLVPFLVDEEENTSANSLPKVYVRNCAVYVFRTQNILKKGILLGKQSVGYVMAPETSVDINSMIDFRFAEYLFVGKADSRLVT